MGFFIFGAIFIINDTFAEPFAPAPVIEHDKTSDAFVRSGARIDSGYAEPEKDTVAVASEST